MLIAILSYVRGCNYERVFEDSLEDIQETINRIKKIDGATETIEVSIGPESMVIAYFPEHQNIITKYKGVRVSNLVRAPAGLPGFSLGEEYIFPPENNQIKGTLQDLAAPNFLGYIKRRPSDCPTETLCICDCENFELITDTQFSNYKTEQAHIRCASEKCTIITDIKTQQKIYLKDFLKYSKNYEEKQEDEEYQILYPQPHTVYWEGGFIMVRTTKFELGESTQQVCTGGGLYYYATSGCAGLVLKDTMIINQKRMIAGHIENYRADFFNLRIKNEGAGTISFEVI